LVQRHSYRERDWETHATLGDDAAISLPAVAA